MHAKANFVERARRPLRLGAVVVVGLFSLGGAQLASSAAAAPSPSRADGGATSNEWKVVARESFNTSRGANKNLSADDNPWVWDRYGDDSPWDHNQFDDDGQFFQIYGGEAFRNQLDTFRTYRKRVTFGHRGWLTAELSCRDRDSDGACEKPPSVASGKRLDGYRGKLGVISEPRADGGVLIRSTKPLPSEYRIEYEQVKMDFGGTRDGEWNYDGRKNGYALDNGLQTNHPWSTSTDPAYYSRPYSQWSDVSSANGFYNLAIADYPAAPYNNVMNHNTMKVRMDTYSTPGGGFRTCNPDTGEYYPNTTGNAFFMSFVSVPQVGGGGAGFYYPPAMTPTECGVNFGPSPGIVGTADEAQQIVPEEMPGNTYRFAVERDATGYTLEVSGCFRYGGCRTIRQHRDFVEDGRPIWHYNQTAQEYNGQFNQPWTYTGPYGSFTADTWPAGSEFPDYFVIGDPHSQYYEGTAGIKNITLSVPAGTD